MDNREILIDSIWQSLQDAPRMKVNELLATMGLSKNMYAKVADQDAKKMVLGLATRLDETALSQVATFVK